MRGLTKTEKKEICKKIKETRIGIFGNDIGSKKAMSDAIGMYNYNTYLRCEYGEYATLEVILKIYRTYKINVLDGI